MWPRCPQLLQVQRMAYADDDTAAAPSSGDLASGGDALFLADREPDPEGNPGESPDAEVAECLAGWRLRGSCVWPRSRRTWRSWRWYVDSSRQVGQIRSFDWSKGSFAKIHR